MKVERRALKMKRELSPTNKAMRKVMFTIVLIIAVSVVVFPLLWMAMSSLKPATELFKAPPSVFPKEPSLVWYKEAFQSSKVIQYFTNSFCVSLGTTLLVTFLAVFASYSLTHFNYPGRKTISILALASYCIPSIMLVVPIYRLVANMGVNNSLFGVIVGHSTATFPFAVWLLNSFFREIPKGIEESAAVNGASDLQIFQKIVLPLTIPGILSTAILVFIMSWNEYLFSSILVSQDTLKTLTVGLAGYADSVEIRWGVIMALSTATTIPIIILFSCVQKYFVEGLTAGSMKG